MLEPTECNPSVVQVGGLARADLLDALAKAGVLLNGSARTLLDDGVFDHARGEAVEVAVRTVGELGFRQGVALPQLSAAAGERGLELCPAATGPYLRLSMLGQAAAPDSVLSNGRAPSGSVTVASVPLREDDEYPRGFYLRVIDGVPWLRGYHCTSQYKWSPQDAFAFRLRPDAGD